jgi:hypothetical protein
MTEPRDLNPGDDEQLRALFEDAVADVDPPPALHHIRNRTSAKVTTMNSKRPWIFAALGAVAATAATLVAVTVVSNNDPEPTAGPAGSDSASPTPGGTEPSETTKPTEPTDSAPSDDPTAAPGESTSLPVYYVGETPAGTRLFREFHRETVEDESVVKAARALELAITGSALRDPDYRTDWPAGSALGSVSATQEQGGPLITVDLRGDVEDRPAGMSEEQATMAVQQLVYTAQAVFQQRHPVEFLVDGEPVDTLLGVPVAEQAVAGDPMEVQASVWIISPQDSDTVDGTFVVEGRGIFFEANVSWQLLRDGQVVDEGFTTAEDGMSLAPYSFEVTAEPGDYVLRVYDADMSGGEGNGEAEDTKQIIVE